MRLRIAIFLLSVFAFQALPFMVLGKAAVKVNFALADDEPGDDTDGDGTAPDGAKAKKGAALEDEFLQHSTKASCYYAVRAARLLQLHRPDHLPLRYAGEVTTPPPDVC